MNKWISKSLVTLMVFNTVGINSAHAAGDIQNAHSCKITKKSTREVIQGICGQKAQPDDADNVLVDYRTFTDPQTNQIVEQYHLSNGQTRTIKMAVKPDLKEASRVQLSANERVFAEQIRQQEQAKETVATDNTAYYISIGAAIVAVIGAGMGIHALTKSKASGARELEAGAGETKEARVKKLSPAVRAQLAKSPILEKLPARIRLGKDVPGGKAGARVKVAGAVDSASVNARVPRFRTSSGDTYIIQQNPRSGYCEVVFLYPGLPYPYWIPGTHIYTVFEPGPFMYSSNNTIVIHDSYAANSAITFDSRSAEDYVGNADVREANTFVGSSGHQAEYVKTADTVSSAGGSEYTTTETTAAWTTTASETRASTYEPSAPARSESTSSTSDWASAGGGGGGSDYGGGGGGGGGSGGGGGGGGGGDW